MAKERFDLTSGKNLMWTVTDNENGIVIEFREGLFNESQEVKLLTEFTYGDAPRMARIMREIGVMAQDVTSWTEMKQVCRELKKPEVQATFKAIIVDTIDNICRM